MKNGAEASALPQGPVTWSDTVSSPARSRSFGYASEREPVPLHAYGGKLLPSADASVQELAFANPSMSVPVSPGATETAACGVIARVAVGAARIVTAADP